MKRTSLLAELEIHYIYSLNVPSAHVGHGSHYFTVMVEYIDTFYFKYDVIEDMRLFL